MIGFVSIIHVITCVLLVLVVLIQSGKGAEISASFAGSSQTVFGSSGGANFFTRFTGGAAAIFFITSLYLTINGTTQNRNSVFDRVAGTPGASAPVSTAATVPGTTTGATAPGTAAGAVGVGAPAAAAPAAPSAQTGAQQAPVPAAPAK